MLSTFNADNSISTCIGKDNLMTVDRITITYRLTVGMFTELDFNLEAFTINDRAGNIMIECNVFEHAIIRFDQRYINALVL